MMMQEPMGKFGHSVDTTGASERNNIVEWYGGGDNYGSSSRKPIKPLGKNPLLAALGVKFVDEGGNEYEIGLG